MMKKINLRKALEAAESERQQNRLLSVVNFWLAEDANADHRVLHSIRNLSSKELTLPYFTGIERQRIFSLSAIRAVAVKYRLRFLKSPFFSGEIPAEALTKVKKLKKETGIEVSSFYVLAPSKAFKLGDCNEDPLLFAQLSDGRFYLVHQWGNDLHPKRSVINWPLRSVYHLVITALVFSLILTLLLPTGFFTNEPSAAYLNSGRVVFFFWTNLLLASILSYTFFAFHIIFSAQNWNSKFFND